MQIFEIGSYKLVIKDNDATDFNPFPHSAALYKGDELFAKFRSEVPISPDGAMEFFIDMQLLKRKKQAPFVK
jgi:hypothetical protein